jgi:hypothetical protein
VTGKKTETSMNGERVGYGNPPKSSRFVKGQSGNLGGRPPKTVSASTGGESEYDAMFLEELKRQVSVREGESIVKTTVERAATRAILLKAAKGDVKAFVAVKAKREAIDERRRVQKGELLRVVSDYKRDMTQELRLRTKLRVSGPEIIPHPDDVIIDPMTGSITINGPMNEDQKMAQDMLVSRWPTIERRWRESPPIVAKNVRHLRQYEKLKRQMEKVGRLVAKRASRINSWDMATLEERIAYLRRSLAELLTKIQPSAVVRSELCFKLMLRDWLGIEPTEEEHQAVILEIREIFALA